MTRTLDTSRSQPKRAVAAATLVLALGAAGLVSASARPALAVGVPATPAGLPAGLEAYQPYVGQLGCDPVAKPGVLAFQRMLMDTYRDTGSLGIVRDCGIGGQSEHKEGRAFDWAVSVNNANQVAEVNAVIDWLLAAQGNEPAVNARRLGIMYMIWNHRIWKAYQPSLGWQAYTGPVPHTDHVHFSFGWNAAKLSTSWWSKRVAPIDYGPYQAGPPPSVTPVAAPGNLAITLAYGLTTLQQGSSGPAVAAMQTGLKIPADGDFGPVTAGKVRDFQASQALPATGVFGPTEWARLFPRPVSPFGGVDTAAMSTVTGWALDPDTSDSISVQVTVDGKAWGAPALANRPRPDLAPIYPGVGTYHGYSLPVDVPAGDHQVCVVGINVGAGADAVTNCRSVTVQVADTALGHFVDALYRDLLGRPSDPAGLSYWYAGLLGGAPRSQVAVALTRSDEYLGRLISSSYTTILGRPADQAGLANWLGAVRGPMAPAALVGSFYQSNEYYVRAGSNDGLWVDALYRAMLGRPADQAGHDYWVSRVAQSGRGAVAAALYGSPESLRQRVQAQYRALLGRDADAQGLATWPSVVAQQGDLALVASLVSSPEYDARAQRR